MKKKKHAGRSDTRLQHPSLDNTHHGRIVSVSDDSPHLDTVQLNRLEASFREWVDAPKRKDVRLSRRRILIIFLLIRYTGAKLNEVLALNPFDDLDFNQQLVRFKNHNADGNQDARQVHISENLAREIHMALGDPAFKDFLSAGFDIDPGFVRRKFYERARACGFPAWLGGPETIRKARAVELMQSNIPLPAVQALLGHSTPNLTSAYVSFSVNEIQEMMKFFMQREAARKTSARNSFFGKIARISKGDIQSRIELTTISGHRVSAMITNDSLMRLGLNEGRLLVAEVKAPWIILQKSQDDPDCSAENRFKGIVTDIKMGEVNTEYTMVLPDGTELCSLVTTESSRRLALEKGDNVWALFNCYAVVLHID